VSDVSSNGGGLFDGRNIHVLFTDVSTHEDETKAQSRNV